MPASKEPVKFRTCDLFDRTAAAKFQENQTLVSKFEEFQKHKANNPVLPFGSSDKMFRGDGFFRGLKHAHLSHDISVIYSISGKNPTLIDLYGLFSHDDLGTGNPPNLKRQKSLSKRLSNQTFS